MRVGLAHIGNILYVDEATAHLSINFSGFGPRVGEAQEAVESAEAVQINPMASEATMIAAVIAAVKARLSGQYEMTIEPSDTILVFGFGVHEA